MRNLNTFSLSGVVKEATKRIFEGKDGKFGFMNLKLQTSVGLLFPKINLGERTIDTDIDKNAQNAAWVCIVDGVLETSPKKDQAKNEIPGEWWYNLSCYDSSLWMMREGADQEINHVSVVGKVEKQSKDWLRIAMFNPKGKKNKFRYFRFRLPGTQIQYEGKNVFLTGQIKIGFTDTDGQEVKNHPHVEANLCRILY